MISIKNLLKHESSTDWETQYRQALANVSDPRLQHFYQQGVCPANTPLSETRFVALDFETTGLSPDKDDIISIGLVPFTLNRVYLRQAKHWFVSPNRPLEEDSVKIHGITHSDIIDAPDLSRVLEELLEAIAGSIVVVHYKAIERQFLDKALVQRIGEGILFPVVDTLELETAIQHKAVSGIMNRLKGTKPQSVRLSKSRTRYGLPPYSPHHALVDAIATAELLQAQVAHHFTPETTISEIWS